MLLKCADIGHLTAAPKTHKRWAVQLEEEFFRQASPPTAAQHYIMRLVLCYCWCSCWVWSLDVVDVAAIYWCYSDGVE